MNCVNCTELSKILGEQLCKALPAFHAFTDSDYTASFYTKGKVRPFEILSKNVTFQEVFADLNDPGDIDDDDKIDILEEYTALLYGIQRCTSVNAARMQCFENLYANSKVSEKFLRKVKGFDSSIIPPCLKSLRQKILRTIFATSMWKKATEAKCVKLEPLECGWMQNGKTIEPLWFKGEPAPKKVEEVILRTFEPPPQETAESEPELSSGDESPGEV